MAAHHFRYLDGNTGYFIWLATIVLIQVHYCISYQDVLLVACLKNMSRVNLLLSVSQLTWNHNDFGYDYSQRSFRTLHLFYCILGLLGIQPEEFMCVLFESTFQEDRILSAITMLKLALIIVLFYFESFENEVVR